MCRDYVLSSRKQNVTCRQWCAVRAGGGGGGGGGVYTSVCFVWEGVNMFSKRSSPSFSSDINLIS